MNTTRNETALITGSAIRLGKHIALALAEQGYDIAIHYNSSTSAAQETVKLIQSKGAKCELFQYDLTDAENMNGFMADVKNAFPSLSVLVNSASGYTQATIANTTPTVFDTQFALNLRAPFFLTQAFAQLVEKGNIINILDNKIGFNQYQYAAYLLAKKSLVELTKMAAVEFAPRIRVNGVAPGVVLPASTRSQEYIEWRLQSIPLHMQGSTEHITQAIISLLDNTFITGQFLTVDGGENIAQIGRNAGEFDQKKV